MKFIWLLLIFNLTTFIAFGQKKVKVKTDFYKEIKYLNKDGIEDGAYQMTTKKGTILIIGKFDKGKKVGTWYYRDRRGQKYLTYNFDENKIIYSKITLQIKEGNKWTTLENNIPYSNQIGEYFYLIYKEFSYPSIAYKNRVEGTINIAIELDKSGISANSVILREIGGGLGEEALRLVKLKQLEWDIPNEENQYRIIIPIKFSR